MLEPSPPARRLLGDEAAYVLPMAVFLLLTQVGIWWPGTYPLVYAVKTAATAGLLYLLWPHYTRISWKHWRLGVVMGVVGVVQWVAMEKLLLQRWPAYPRLSAAPFDPTRDIGSIPWRWTFIAIRWAGASLVVPVMEELFWRDFLWRTTAAPRDFKLAAVGERDLQAWLLVSLLFSAVHIQWITAIVWGLLAGGLLMFTRSLGACIVMHGVTNFLLGLYVLLTSDWYFW